MNKDNFIYKSYCELGITSQEFNPEIITELLGINPFNSYCKGDTFLSKRENFTAKRFQNLWAIKSETIISEKEDLTPHILHFKSILCNKLDLLHKFKNDPRYNVSFWIWVETDNAGIGIDLTCDELAFINSIANRVHFSIITNQDNTNIPLI